MTKDTLMDNIDVARVTETTGTVDRFLLDPHGAVWVLLLTDGTEVHFPPHLSTEIVTAVRPGSEVTVRGVRPRGDCIVAAASLETADGTRVVAREPRAPLFRQR
jgi:hypothetical protein